MQSDPSPTPSSNGTKLGMVERIVAILSSLTFQNVMVLGILMVLAVPSYAVWQLLHDSTLRKEIMSYAKETDMGVPCQVIVYSFSGQGERTTVISGVQVIGQWEIVAGTKTYGQMTAKEAEDACKLMLETGSQLRTLLAAGPK